MLATRFGYKSSVIGVAGWSVSARLGLGDVLMALAAALIMLPMAACSAVEPSTEPPLPELGAALRLSHGLAMSRLSYQDACGDRRDFALGPAIEDAFQSTVARTFSRAQGSAGAAPPTGVDRVLDVDLETGELILFVEQGVSRRYPANVALSVVVTAYDASGKALDLHRLGTNVSGTVWTEVDRCLVNGAEQVAAEAVETLADEFGQYLRTSREIASGTVSAEAPGPAVALTFRARLLDADGDQVLEGEEEVTLEVEVTNVGTGPAREVSATVSGSADLVRQLPPVIAFGDLQPGESKRQTVKARLGSVAAAGEAELVLSLRSRSALRQAPARKKFLIILRPKHTAGWRLPHKPVDSAKGS